MSSSNKMFFSLSAFFLVIIVVLSLIRTGKQSTSDEGISSQQLQKGDAFVQYDYQEIAPDVIYRKMRSAPKSVALVDIRPGNRYAREHITGSFHLPLSTLLEGGVAPHYDADMVVVVFDDLSAEKLSRAIKIFEKNNSYVVALSGGFSAWKSYGAPTISIGDPTSIVDAAKITYIAADDVAAMIADKATDIIILDVRSAPQFAQGHIPHAINIPLSTLERRYNTLSILKPIVVYGETTDESFRGGVRLYDLHFPTVKTLAGGYVDWVRGNHAISTE